MEEISNPIRWVELFIPLWVQWYAGLHEKYSQDGITKGIIMSGLEMKYFVLNPNKNDAYGKASRRAIYHYAAEIYKENKQLAEDLCEWMDDIGVGLKEKK